VRVYVQLSFHLVGHFWFSCFSFSKSTDNQTWPALARFWRARLSIPSQGNRAFTEGRLHRQKYDRYQRRLLREIIKAIRKDLSESNVAPALICELTENIAFSVSAIVDGSHVMQVDGRRLRQFLPFVIQAILMRWFPTG